jgi:hypothetical protein
MVAGWANGAESVFQFTRHHGVGGIQGSTSRAQSSMPCMDIHGGVGVKRSVGRPSRLHVFNQGLTQTSERCNVHAIMRQFDVGQRGRRRLSAFKGVIKSSDKQAILNGV